MSATSDRPRPIARRAHFLHPVIPNQAQTAAKSTPTPHSDVACREARSTRWGDVPLRLPTTLTPVAKGREGELPPGDIAQPHHSARSQCHPPVRERARTADRRRKDSLPRPRGSRIDEDVLAKELKRSASMHPRLDCWGPFVVPVSVVRVSHAGSASALTVTDTARSGAPVG